MSVRLIGDPGSTHDGDLKKARELVSIGAACGLDAIKFQLLTPAQCQGGNILLPWEWLPELIELGRQKGVEVFASVFDRGGLDWLVKCGCASIKYSFSQREFPLHSALGADFRNKCVSLDVMDDLEEVRDWIKLYCTNVAGAPLYPVPFLIDFEGIFPRFDGFSSHCLGIQQEIRAAEAGAKYLEFHFQGDWQSSTPDAKFAKSPALTEKLCKSLK